MDDNQLSELLSKEYFAMVDIVKTFDQRLLTIKGWGVTLSLAAIGFGFQYQHRGMFLLAAASGVAFWAVEAIVHRHQMNYYVRMRDIEVVAADMQRQPDPIRSTPQIDWSWSTATEILEGKPRGRGTPDEFPGPPRIREASRAYRQPWMWPIVWLPHGITVVLGGVLFLLGQLNVFVMGL